MKHASYPDLIVNPPDWRWLPFLKRDPLPMLLRPEIPALYYFVRRDLLGNVVESVEELWQLPEVHGLLHRQREGGFWRYPGGQDNLRSQTNYDQLETYRILGELVEKYGLNRKHPALQNAAEFLFSLQTEDGDFRGIYGTQYTPNYSAAIMELLIKAGYMEDIRIRKGFDWLLYMRQNDGGWAIPFRTRKYKFDASTLNSTTLEPDRTKPFSHLITGIVLRAFAAHPDFCYTKEARLAGRLLCSRFFERDSYPDRRGESYWTKFSYPFWFTDLLSSMDSLVKLGFGAEEPNIKKALNWFEKRQQDDGLWDLSLLRNKDKALKYWLALAICRVILISTSNSKLKMNGGC